MYNVYINERLLRFVSVHDLLGSADMVLKLTGDESKSNLRVLIEAFEQNLLTETMVLQSANIDKTWKTFKSLYTVMHAAGGVVINENHQLLMIFRNGKWDLPKGKIEAGEEADAAAIREVYEECGIGMLKLSKQIVTTFHTYPYKESKVLKKTYWFLMSTKDTATPVPQYEENILDVQWMNKTEIKKALLNSYASIARLLQEQVLEPEHGLLG
jgi:8-oxo-dGTP pyrophosphatase MutT (NUDIX family)